MKTALYTPEQLQIERSRGLELSDYENENFYNSNGGDTYYWSNDQFEVYLSTKHWDEKVKDIHRSYFNGAVTFEDGKISYD